MRSFVLLSIRRFTAVCMVAACAVSAASVTSFAQACGGRGVPPPKSSGTKYLLVFMRNEAPGYDQSDSRYQDIYLASNEPTDMTTVTITCRAFPGWSKVISLPPHGSSSFRITKEPEITFPARDAIIEIPENVDSTVFKVEATAPITCYGMNNKQFTSDAFLALPYDAATPEYRVMSFANSTQLTGDQNMPSEFAVASFDNGNTVTVIPTAVTSTGNPPGKPMTFTLDSGECVQIEGSPNDEGGDMTGSTVRSSKPVVVYGGHVRTESPTGFNYDQNGQHTSRDHMCEAMPPLSTWGTSFIAKNFGRPLGDILRVLASVDNTVVKINGKVWGAPLKANAFRDTIIAQSNIALENIAAVESSDPILVAMIAHTAAPDDQVGDPFLAIVPPLQQTYNDFTFFLTDDTINYLKGQQFVIIATEQSGAGKITVGNLTPPPAAYTVLPNAFSNGKHYAVTTLNLPVGIHHITSQNQIQADGFTILAYGWGNVISYGYTAGQLLIPFKGIIPLTSLTPNMAPGGGDHVPNAPAIIVRNIMSEKLYFDSARVSYSQNPQNIAVNLKKDIALETGTIEMAEEKTLELATSRPVEDAISGKIRIWYHSRLYTDLAPVDFPFVITPQPQAGVTNDGHRTVLLENNPNPAAGSTTIHFNLPERTYATVKIYDALGRAVRTVSQGMLNSGEQSIPVLTRGLIPGDYTLELAAPKLGINEHRKMIVVE